MRRFLIEKLFNSKCATLPTWLSVVLTALVLSASFLVLTDLAGVLDFVARSKPMEVKELRIPSDMTILSPEVTDYMVKRVESHGKRGMYSYYLEAYPIILGLDCINKAEDVGKYMTNIMLEKSKLETDEERNAYDEAHKEELTQYTDNLKASMEDIQDKTSLMAVSQVMYRMLSLILGLWILKIPTGLGVKLEYWWRTRKIKWVM